MLDCWQLSNLFPPPSLCFHYKGQLRRKAWVHDLRGCSLHDGGRLKPNRPLPSRRNTHPALALDHSPNPRANLFSCLSSLLDLFQRPSLLPPETSIMCNKPHILLAFMSHHLSQHPKRVLGWAPFSLCKVSTANSSFLVLLHFISSSFLSSLYRFSNTNSREKGNRLYLVGG